MRSVKLTTRTPSCLSEASILSASIEKFFFEVNKKLDFNRAAAYGMRLDIPAGTAVRFEPGETKTVNLVEIGGSREGHGLNGLVEGLMDDEKIKSAALDKASAEKFAGV